MTDKMRANLVKWLADESGEPEHLVTSMTSVYVDPEKLLAKFDSLLSSQKQEIVEEIENIDIMLAMVQSSDEATGEIIKMIGNIRKQLSSLSNGKEKKW